jgi:hypothetical protein
VVARISQQQLAAECRTVRGVVVRELRVSGLVTTRRDAITIPDPTALLGESGRDDAWASGT